MPNVTSTLSPGTRWAAATSPAAKNLRGIAVSQTGRWIVAAQTSAPYSYYSDDHGATWTAGGTMTNGSSMFGMVYGDGLFVASAGTSGQTIFSSPDGVTWTNRFNPGGGAGWDMYQLVYNDGYFTLGVDDDNAVVFASDAGTSWVSNPQGSLNTGVCVSAIYVAALNRTFAAATSNTYKYNNTIPTSATAWAGNATGLTGNIWGICWSHDLSMACAVGDNGVFTSSNLTDWTQRTTDANMKNVAWCTNQFVAVGFAGKILTSPDGVTWTARTSGTTAELYGVAENDGVILVTGDSGVVLKSVD